MNEDIGADVLRSARSSPVESFHALPALIFGLFLAGSWGRAATPCAGRRPVPIGQDRVRTVVDAAGRTRRFSLPPQGCTSFVGPSESLGFMAGSRAASRFSRLARVIGCERDPGARSSERPPGDTSRLRGPAGPAG